MVAGGHLDARRCGRVGSWLAGSRQPEERGLVGNTVRGPERHVCWRAVWNAGSTARTVQASVLVKLTGSSKHVSFCFYVFCSFTFSALFHIICNFGMFCPQKKKYLFFLCNISSLCAISYVPMVAIYVYQLNIWLIFKKHVAEFHVYFSWRRQMPLFALQAPSSRRTQSAARRVEEFPSVNLNRKTWLLEGQLHNGVCFWHGRLKRCFWNLQISFKLKMVLQSDPHYSVWWTVSSGCCL